MKVDFRPTVVECRVYDGGSYEERSPYKQGSFVIHILGDVAEVSLLTAAYDMMHSAWTPTVDRETVRYLRENGVKRMRYEHKHKYVERRL